MSDRTPLNEAAAQRRRLAPADMEVSPELAGEQPGAPRRVRKPFGGREQKLSYPNRPGYHRHWFNDEPGRLLRATEAGYEHVKDEHGKTVSTIVGISRGGGPLTAYLMETPKQWHDEDMAAQDSAVHEQLGQIRSGEFERPTGRDGSLRYAGSTRGNISIESNSRR